MAYTYLSRKDEMLAKNHCSTAMYSNILESTNREACSYVLLSIACDLEDMNVEITGRQYAGRYSGISCPPEIDRHSYLVSHIGVPTGSPDAQILIAC